MDLRNQTDYPIASGVVQQDVGVVPAGSKARRLDDVPHAGNYKALIYVDGIPRRDDERWKASYPDHEEGVQIIGQALCDKIIDS